MVRFMVLVDVRRMGGFLVVVVVVVDNKGVEMVRVERFQRRAKSIMVEMAKAKMLETESRRGGWMNVHFDLGRSDFIFNS